MKGKKQTPNQRIEKLSQSPAARRQVFKELCKHLSDGYSLDSFPLLSAITTLSYLKSYPDEFVQADFDHAKRQGRDTWERIGMSQAIGTSLGNSRTWFYNMANRYGWQERVQVEAEHKGSVNINVVSYASVKARDANHDKD